MEIHLSGGGKREEAGFKAMEKYTRIRHNTVLQSIATQSILDLCEETERTPGVWVGMPWWEQAGIDLAGARERATYWYRATVYHAPTACTSNT